MYTLEVGSPSQKGQLLWDRITVRLPQNSVMVPRTYKPGEYFSCPVVAKSSEQISLELSRDNSVDISRKDLDDHEPVVDESTRENLLTRKDVRIW